MRPAIEAQLRKHEEQAAKLRAQLGITTSSTTAASGNHEPSRLVEPEEAEKKACVEYARKHGMVAACQQYRISPRTFQRWQSEVVAAAGK